MSIFNNVKPFCTLATVLLLVSFNMAYAHTGKEDEETRKHQSEAKPTKVVGQYLGGDIYGSEWPKSAKIETIETALVKYRNRPTEPMIFSGEITKVCQKKGCWMILTHNGEHCRINFNNHEYFIPKDASGYAMVYGVLNNKTLSESFRKHLAEDEGEDASQIKGTEDVFEVLAQSVVIFQDKK